LKFPYPSFYPPLFPYYIVRFKLFVFGYLVIST